MGVDLETFNTGVYSSVCGTQVLVVVGRVKSLVSSFGEKLENDSLADGKMLQGAAYSLVSDDVDAAVADGVGCFSFLFDLSLIEFRVVMVMMVFSGDIVAVDEQWIDVGAGGGGPFGRSENFDFASSYDIVASSFTLADIPTFSFSASPSDLFGSVTWSELLSTEILKLLLPLRSNTLILLLGGFGGAFERRELNFGFSLIVGASMLLPIDIVRPFDRLA
jgi:hypothetical protein